MTSENKEVVFTPKQLGELLSRTRKEQLNRLAQWMIHNGFSTGHGSTFNDLLTELEEEAVAKRDTETCAWEYSDPDYNEWYSQCGFEFRFEDGGPIDNKMKYCCVCGKPMIETINPNIDYENDEWKE